MTSEVFVNALFPKELEKQARITAAHLSISRGELVRRAVTDYLKRIETQPQKEGNREQKAA